MIRFFLVDLGNGMKPWLAINKKGQIVRVSWYLLKRIAEKHLRPLFIVLLSKRFDRGIVDLGEPADERCPSLDNVSKRASISVYSMRTSSAMLCF